MKTISKETGKIVKIDKGVGHNQCNIPLIINSYAITNIQVIRALRKIGVYLSIQ